jgi:signal transduction histidine kinase
VHATAGTVTVEVESDSLVVTDTGVGIAGAHIERVFERHYRGEGSSGSGIGLALVKRICDTCGWAIVLDSRQGVGTIARLLFHPPRPS